MLSLLRCVVDEADLTAGLLEALLKPLLRSQPGAGGRLLGALLRERQAALGPLIQRLLSLCMQRGGAGAAPGTDGLAGRCMELLYQVPLRGVVCALQSVGGSRGPWKPCLRGFWSASWEVQGVSLACGCSLPP